MKSIILIVSILLFINCEIHGQAIQNVRKPSKVSMQSVKINTNKQGLVSVDSKKIKIKGKVVFVPSYFTKNIKRKTKSAYNVTTGLYEVDLTNNIYISKPKSNQPREFNLPFEDNSSSTCAIINESSGAIKGSKLNSIIRNLPQKKSTVVILASTLDLSNSTLMGGKNYLIIADTIYFKDSLKTVISGNIGGNRLRETVIKLVCNVICFTGNAINVNIEGIESLPDMPKSNQWINPLANNSKYEEKVVNNGNLIFTCNKIIHIDKDSSKLVSYNSDKIFKRINFKGKDSTCRIRFTDTDFEYKYYNFLISKHFNNLKNAIENETDLFKIDKLYLFFLNIKKLFKTDSRYEIDEFNYSDECDKILTKFKNKNMWGHRVVKGNANKIFEIEVYDTGGVTNFRFALAPNSLKLISHVNNDSLYAGRILARPGTDATINNNLEFSMMLMYDSTSFKEAYNYLWNKYRISLEMTMIKLAEPSTELKIQSLDGEFNSYYSGTLFPKSKTMLRGVMGFTNSGTDLLEIIKLFTLDSFYLVKINLANSQNDNEVYLEAYLPLRIDTLLLNKNQEGKQLSNLFDLIIENEGFIQYFDIISNFDNTFKFDEDDASLSYFDKVELSILIRSGSNVEKIGPIILGPTGFGNYTERYYYIQHDADTEITLSGRATYDNESIIVTIPPFSSSDNPIRVGEANWAPIE